MQNFRPISFRKTLPIDTSDYYVAVCHDARLNGSIAKRQETKG